MIFFGPRGCVNFFWLEGLHDFLGPIGCMTFFWLQRLCDFFVDLRDGVTSF